MIRTDYTIHFQYIDTALKQTPISASEDRIAIVGRQWTGNYYHCVCRVSVCVLACFHFVQWNFFESSSICFLRHAQKLYSDSVYRQPKSAHWLVYNKFSRLSETLNRNPKCYCFNCQRRFHFWVHWLRDRSRRCMGTLGAFGCMTMPSFMSYLEVT